MVAAGADLLRKAHGWTAPALFVLSRAAFGQDHHARRPLVGPAQGACGQLLLSWTWRRLRRGAHFRNRSTSSGLRSASAAAARRAARRVPVPAWLTTSAFATAETLLVIGLVSMAVWLAPSPRETVVVMQGIGNFSASSSLLLPCAYAVVVLFLEPFYVGTGFAMYLNRRAELEAWTRAGAATVPSPRNLRAARALVVAIATCGGVAPDLKRWLPGSRSHRRWRRSKWP